MGSINSIMIFSRPSLRYIVQQVEQRYKEGRMKSVSCVEYVISQGGVSGKNVRKCEKGEGGGVLKISPKSVISYLNSP